MDDTLEAVETEIVVTNPAESGLVLVHLDFHDGSKCKVWLQPKVVKRLQDGDDALMEELRLQHATTRSTDDTPVQVKRKIESQESLELDDSGEGVKKVRTNEEDVGGETTTWVLQSGDTTASLVSAANSAAAGQQVVNVNLNGVEQGSYLEELTVGEGNYIELPTGSAYQTYSLQQGLLIESYMEQATAAGNIKEEKLKPAYPYRKRRKKGLRRYMKYSVEDRDEAIKMVKSGLLSQQEASRKYNIPQGTLSDHIRAGAPVLKCGICNKTFGVRSALEHHHLSHYEAKPYLCDYCGFNTKDRTILLKHRRLQHTEATDEYSDDDPTAAAATSADLQKELNPAKISAWNAEATKVFLEEYESVMVKYDDTDMKKKHLWHTLADRMCAKGHFVNARQCATKWKTMYTSYKAFTEQGEDRRAFNYFNEMEAFIARRKGKYVNIDELQPHEDREKLVWNHDAILMLISEYEKRKAQFESTAVKRKVLWKNIHQVFKDAGLVLTEGQVQNKWKVLVRQFKNYQALNLPRDEVIKYFPWYNEMAAVMPSSQLSDETVLPMDDSGFLPVVEKTEIIKSEACGPPEEIQYIEEGAIHCGAILEAAQDEEVEMAVLQVQAHEHMLQVDPNAQSMDGTTTQADSSETVIFKIENADEENNVGEGEQETSVQKVVDAEGNVIQAEISGDTEGTLVEMDDGRVVKTIQVQNEDGQLMLLQQITWPEGPGDEEAEAEGAGGQQGEEMAEEADTSINKEEGKPTKKVDWTDEGVKFLFAQYIGMLDKFRNVLVKKKTLWHKMEEKFTAAGYEMTAAQLENKWRVLTRMFVKAKSEDVTANNNTYPYFEEMHAIVETSNEDIEVKPDENDKDMYGIEEGSKVWPHSATMVLLEEYEKRFHQFEDSGVKKWVLWQEIADALAVSDIAVTAGQTENKWKVLLRCYKVATGQIYTPAGKKPREFPYLSRMAEILGTREDHSESILTTADGDSRECNAHWGHEATMLLLTEYGLRLDRFESDYIKRKEYLWHEIYTTFKEKGFNYTIAQLTNKWKSLLKKYRTVTDVLYGTSLHEEDGTLDPKQVRKIQKFPYLIEMGQLLGQNHDISHLGISITTDGCFVPTESLETPSISGSSINISDSPNTSSETTLISSPGKKLKSELKKKQILTKEPSSYQDVMKLFEQYETEREELEKNRLDELKRMQLQKLKPLTSADEMLVVFKEYEAKRQEVDKHRMEEMSRMHKEKMAMLKNLLKAVKKKKTVGVKAKVKTEQEGS